MDNYIERMINDLPIKISNIDMDLLIHGNNIFETGNIKILGKKETE